MLTRAARQLGGVAVAGSACAFAAATMVADSSGREGGEKESAVACRPLVVCGPSGAGKRYAHAPLAPIHTHVCAHARSLPSSLTTPLALCLSHSYSALTLHTHISKHHLPSTPSHLVAPLSSG